MADAQPSADHWAIVPAAGIGARMGAQVPKQYLPLAGRPVLAHTLERLAAHPRIAGIVLALREAYPHWQALGFV
ncbi:MAG TPA: 2-C-methyl-D-erythritol 4-phosphate cytidylyltransferase, partial [Immundisolibacter sp.]